MIIEYPIFILDRLLCIVLGVIPFAIDTSLDAVSIFMGIPAILAYCNTCCELVDWTILHIVRCVSSSSICFISGVVIDFTRLSFVLLQLVLLPLCVLRFLRRCCDLLMSILSSFSPISNSAMDSRIS